MVWPNTDTAVSALGDESTYSTVAIIRTVLASIVMVSVSERKVVRFKRRCCEGQLTRHSLQ